MFLNPALVLLYGAALNRAMREPAAQPLLPSSMMQRGPSERYVPDPDAAISHFQLQPFDAADGSSEIAYIRAKNLYLLCLGRDAWRRRFGARQPMHPITTADILRDLDRAFSFGGNIDGVAKKRAGDGTTATATATAAQPLPLSAIVRSTVRAISGARERFARERHTPRVVHVDAHAYSTPWRKTRHSGQLLKVEPFDATQLEALRRAVLAAPIAGAMMRDLGDGENREAARQQRLSKMDETATMIFAVILGWARTSVDTRRMGVAFVAAVKYYLADSDKSVVKQRVLELMRAFDEKFVWQRRVTLAEEVHRLFDLL